MHIAEKTIEEMAEEGKAMSGIVNLCYSKCGPWTSSVDVTLQSVPSAELHTPPETF